MTTPAEILPLANGLDLELHDKSKRLVGDRWSVILVARVRVDVTAEDAAAALGTEVIYEQRRERVFVDDAEKTEVYAELRESFLSTQKPYLSRPDFAERLVRRRLAEAQERTV